MESGCKNRIYSCISRASYLALGVGYTDTLDEYRESNVKSMLNFIKTYLDDGSLVFYDAGDHTALFN